MKVRYLRSIKPFVNLLEIKKKKKKKLLPREEIL